MSNNKNTEWELARVIEKKIKQETDGCIRFMVCEVVTVTPFVCRLVGGSSEFEVKKAGSYDATEGDIVGIIYWGMQEKYAIANLSDDGGSNESVASDKLFTGVVKFGSTSNYVQIDADGELTLNGTATVFDDILPSGISIGVGASAPSFSAYNGNMCAYEFVGVTTTKEVFLAFQMPHSYKEGSNIFPHLYLYCPNDVSGGIIKFFIEYTWINLDGVEGATTTVSATLTRGAGAGINGNLAIPFAAISGSGKTMSSILACRLYRVPTDAGDTFASSVWLKSAVAHFEKDTMGSKSEYIK